VLNYKIESMFFHAPQAISLYCVKIINDLIDRSDNELFKKVCSASRSLYHLLPPYRRPYK